MALDAKLLEQAETLGIDVSKIEKNELLVAEIEKAELKAAEAKKAPAKLKYVKVEFTKSPTGDFLLAYNVGDVAKIESKLAQELVDAGYAKTPGKKA